MKKNKINYNNHLQKKLFNTSLIKKFEKKYRFIFKDLMQSLASTQNIFYFLNKNFKLDFKLKDLKKYKKFKTIVVIGMGGSILGAEAIHEFLKHKIKKKFIFLDDIDHFKIEKINKNFKKEKLLFLIISKSGNTTETLSNLFALKVLKKEAKNIIIICEKGKNGLYYVPKSHKNKIQFKNKTLRKDGLIKPGLINKRMDIKIFKSKIGQCFIFNDRLVHGGLSGGKKTRISLEFTMLIKNKEINKNFV